MRKRIIFWGATGQAKVLAEFIGALGFELVALFDNNPATPAPVAGVPLLFGREGFAKWRAERAGETIYGLVAIGGARGRDRLDLQRFFGDHGVALAVAIHPSAVVASNVRMGAGAQVLAGATISAEAVLGEGCIVNTAASVDHECVLGSGVHIGPGATLSGCVEVGECSFVGAGAVVLPRIRIGRNVTIGAGAVVTKDVRDNCVAYGNPARVAREIEAKG